MRLHCGGDMIVRRGTKRWLCKLLLRLVLISLFSYLSATSVQGAMPPPDATGGAGDPADVDQGCKYHVISGAESDRSVLLQILGY